MTKKYDAKRDAWFKEFFANHTVAPTAIDIRGDSKIGMAGAVEMMKGMFNDSLRSVVIKVDDEAVYKGGE